MRWHDKFVTACSILTQIVSLGVTPRWAKVTGLGGVGPWERVARMLRKVLRSGLVPGLYKPTWS